MADLREELQKYIEKLRTAECERGELEARSVLPQDRVGCYNQTADELESLLARVPNDLIFFREMFENQPEISITRDEAIHIDIGDSEDIVSLYPAQRRAVFHDQYTQTARSRAALKPLLDFLDKAGYSTNLS